MAMNENNNTSIKWHRVVVMTILCLFGFSLITTVAAPDKKKKRKKTDERVYLKHADVPGAQILRGKVHFTHAGSQLWCDSAYFFQVENSVMAFGHVRFKQGDTLSLTCDRADYNGADQMMHARNNVVLKHRGVHTAQQHARLRSTMEWRCSLVRTILLLIRCIMILVRR